MAEQLTPQQRQAVYDRGGKLLISAAAGSGKTKVLVDRLLRYVTDPQDPANLDDFLMITYTKAAASELRSKIAAKLSERIAEDPTNRHLQQQMQRLYLTKISTVHSFCSDILREYAYALDLAADFRVADENECKELRDKVVIQLLEDMYRDAPMESDFYAFVDSQGLGRNDGAVPEIVLQIYDRARCHLSPDRWLDTCVNNTEVEDISDASQISWGRFLMDDLFSYLDMQIKAMEQCACWAEEEIGWEKPALLLRETVNSLSYLRQSENWDQIIGRKDIDFGRLVISSKKGDQDKASRIKAVRSACVKGLKKKLENFTDRSEYIISDLIQTGPSVRGLVDLVRSFGDRYEKAKRQRRIMDFGDLEHKTLDLLLGKNRTHTTAAAREIGMRFREIMVDEYQDSNEVQDAIYNALTEKKQNLFMVGDVKQSIYQFRLADPGIFLSKYASFVPAEEAIPGQERKILLSSNFRSGGAVIGAVNHIFSRNMTPIVGGLYYTQAEELKEGIPHIPMAEPEIEFYGISVKESTYLEEAAFTAERISQLLDGKHMVRQGDSLRPICAEDIVILLRSPGSVGKYFQKALEQRNISCVSGGGEDLLQTGEIATLRSLLQVISNPRQDIPLISVLMSPVFCFSADEIATFRAKNKNGSIYEALCSWDSDKTRTFLNTLNILRMESRMCSLSQLVEKIFLLTKIDTIYASMTDGKRRTENLQLFYQICVEFEGVGRRDLEHFLDHLSALEERGLITAGEQGCPGAVTIMSIHKSKGLEFPVVFLCGLNREFNREDLRAQVLCHKTMGLGVSYVDKNKRIRYPAISKRAIAVQTVKESLSEEMRVLYVALTRAKDRLIMTYAAKNLSSDISDIAMRLGVGDRELLTGSVGSPGKWVLMSALEKTEAGALFALGDRPASTQISEPVWHIAAVEAPIEEPGGKDTFSENEKIPQEFISKIRDGLSFVYEYEHATKMPSKQTATQMKGRVKDHEVSENAPACSVQSRTWRKASFVEATADGKQYGNAIHAVMQFIRYEACTDMTGVCSEMERLVSNKFITPDQGAMINPESIYAFFSTEIGRKLVASKSCLREFKFSILMDAMEHTEELENEKILLQGVVDCALIETDGITIIDFKTDCVSDENVGKLTAQYKPQVEAYAKALERIYKQPVKASYLYFFSQKSFVRL